MIDLTELTIGERLSQGSQGKVFLAADPRGVRYTVKPQLPADLLGVYVLMPAVI